jgi:RNA polymerase sigma factor (sigma-70 family)
MEKAIIVAASKGDKKSFRMIFDYYLPRMHPVALRYARTVLEADDILQDSFVKIYENIKNYKFTGSFDRWVKVIVINTALNYYKKHRQFYSFESMQEVQEEAMEETLEMEDEDDLIEEVDMSIILEAIDNLPEGYKMVFNLYVFEEYLHKEIATMLGISEGTSRSQFCRARNMLKKNIYKQRNASRYSLNTK